ncbi:unnamed protein product [Moneuplotes crassus]|uniref:Uncharacterized protein n=1 Tax=Euplotes crassus TaxID=5936 RepID=A0AAD1XI07_EUPCR|nr:unnamed protein product [Moneuplotes crassus]
MKIILGTSQGYKTTSILNFGYIYLQEWLSERERDIEDQKESKDSPAPYVVYITSKQKMKENSLVFGTYSEVTIDVLKNIKMKYIDTSEGLINYLIDFHLLKDRPKLVLIDGMELYCTGSNDKKLSQINTSNKKLKVDYLCNLMKHIEELYSNSLSETKFICTHRIFSCIESASTASTKLLNSAKSELNFLISLYVDHCTDVYLMVTSANAGGAPAKLMDSDPEDINIQVDTGEICVANCIFTVCPVTCQTTEKMDDWLELCREEMITLWRVAQSDEIEEEQTSLQRVEEGKEFESVKELVDYLKGEEKQEYDDEGDQRMAQDEEIPASKEISKEKNKMTPSQ